MTRTLLAFGDSHTAGSEIEEQYQYWCYEKAYPAYIAKHFGFEYENYGHPGGSNDWSIKLFLEVIQEKLKNNDSLFVTFNFTEESRTFFVCTDDDWDINVPIHFNVTHLNIKNNEKDLFHFFGPEYLDLGHKTIKYLPFYKHYLRSNISNLDKKTFNQILIVQSICNEYDIPFVMHTSFNWWPGDWSLISHKNFYGHQHRYYNISKCNEHLMKYSYYNYAHHDPKWKDMVFSTRWRGHYSEEYHKYWAAKLIKFIDQQKILEGYI